MDDCVASVTAAVAAYLRRKNFNQLALVLKLLGEEDAVVSRENICGLCNLHRTAAVVTSSVQILDVVGGCFHITVCMARCELPAAFMWLCKPETIVRRSRAVPRHRCK